MLLEYQPGTKAEAAALVPEIILRRDVDKG
jgi:hypothetical protein